MANQNEAVPTGTLPPGTRIGRYTLARLLGQGGFGVTYLAEHQSLQRRVAIKEHFPREFAMRSGSTVAPHSHAVSTFKWARERFLDEARTLSGFRHPAINEVIDVFEANGTAYMVLAFEDAIRFGDWLDKLGRPPTQAELDRIAGPLADALELIHARHFLHRDISPDNILIRPDGSPVLIDFGAARQALGKETKTLTAMVKPGFSPPEQYDTDDSAKQGPWSDIYAFSATLYRAVTGTRPPESTGRVLNDRYWSAQGVADRGYRRSFLEAIDLGLRVHPDARPRSVAEWKSILLGSAPAPAQAQPAAPAWPDPRAGYPTPPSPPYRAHPPQMSNPPQPAPSPPSAAAEPRKRSGFLMSALIGLAAGLAIAGFFVARPYLAQSPEKKPDLALKHETTPARETAAQEWTRLKTSEDTAALERFIAARKDGPEVREARARLETLSSRTALSAPADECDRLAADPDDPQRVADPVDSVDFEVAPTAVEACRQSLRKFPRVARFDYQLARALQASLQDEAALAILRRRTDAGETRAMAALGWAYSFGRGLPVNYVEALRLHRAAADRGDPNGLRGVAFANELGRGVITNRAEAVKWYLRAAEKGSVGAMRSLAYIYSRSKFGEKDLRLSHAWYKRAADLGDATSMLEAALNVAAGRGVERNEAEGQRLIDLALKKGGATAMARLAGEYRYGQRLKADLRTAVKWYTAAAEGNETFSMSVLAEIYKDGELKDLSAHDLWQGRYLAKLRSLAGKGHHVSQTRLGEFYAKGQGVSRDLNEAVRLFRAAAGKNDSISMIRLAAMYAKGVGVPRDAAEAEAWTKRILAHWGPDTLAGLADEYRYGGVVEKDLGEAQRIARRAIDLGSTRVYPLYSAYRWGDGVQQDRAEAVRILRIGAERGEVLSISWLAEALDKGEGTAKNPEEAARWLFVGIERRNDFLIEDLLKPEKFSADTRRALQRQMALANVYSGAVNGELDLAMRQAIETLATR